MDTYTLPIDMLGKREYCAFSTCGVQDPKSMNAVKEAAQRLGPDRRPVFKPSPCRGDVLPIDFLYFGGQTKGYYVPPYTKNADTVTFNINNTDGNITARMVPLKNFMNDLTPMRARPGNGGKRRGGTYRQRN